jgi:hypothetical protein
MEASKTFSIFFIIARPSSCHDTAAAARLDSSATPLQQAQFIDQIPHFPRVSLHHLHLLREAVAAHPGQRVAHHQVYLVHLLHGLEVPLPRRGDCQPPDLPGEVGQRAHVLGAVQEAHLLLAQHGLVLHPRQRKHCLPPLLEAVTEGSLTQSRMLDAICTQRISHKREQKV